MVQETRGPWSIWIIRVGRRFGGEKVTSDGGDHSKGWKEKEGREKEQEALGCVVGLDFPASQKKKKSSKAEEERRRDERRVWGRAEHCSSSQDCEFRCQSGSEENSNTVGKQLRGTRPPRDSSSL